MSVFKDFILNFGLQASRYLLFAGGTYLLVWRWRKEAFKKRRLQGQDFNSEDLKRDLRSSLTSAFVFAIVAALGATSWIQPSMKFYDKVSDYGWTWTLFSFFLVVFIHDTYFYWTHRLLHRPQLFQNVHYLHHKTTNPSPLSSYAFHPLEAFIESIWMIPVFILLPVHVYVVILFFFFALYANICGHLGIEIYPDTWRKNPILKWLNTSTHHNYHHQDAHGNYGVYFIFWDRLMGTENHPL